MNILKRRKNSLRFAILKEMKPAGHKMALPVARIVHLTFLTA